MGQTSGNLSILTSSVSPPCSVAFTIITRDFALRLSCPSSGYIACVLHMFTSTHRATPRYIFFASAACSHVKEIEMSCTMGDVEFGYRQHPWRLGQTFQREISLGMTKAGGTSRFSTTIGRQETFR